MTFRPIARVFAEARTLNADEIDRVAGGMQSLCGGNQITRDSGSPGSPPDENVVRDSQ